MNILKGIKRAHFKIVLIDTRAHTHPSADNPTDEGLEYNLDFTAVTADRNTTFNIWIHVSFSLFLMLMGLVLFCLLHRASVQVGMKVWTHIRTASALISLDQSVLCAICKESNLKSSDPVAASCFHKDFLKHGCVPNLILFLFTFFYFTFLPFFPCQSLFWGVSPDPNRGSEDRGCRMLDRL